MPDTPTSQSVVNLLIVAIGSLAAVIVWLATYIRTMHIRHTKRHDENTKQIIGITEKVTEAIVKVDTTIQLNTKSIESAGQSSSQAMSALDKTVRDLHNYMIYTTK